MARKQRRSLGFFKSLVTRVRSRSAASRTNDPHLKDARAYIKETRKHAKAGRCKEASTALRRSDQALSRANAGYVNPRAITAVEREQLDASRALTKCRRHHGRGK